MKLFFLIFLIGNLLADNCAEIRKLILNHESKPVEVIQADCTDSTTLYNLGVLYYRKKILLPAENLVSKIATDPKDLDLLFLLAKIEISLNKLTDARKILEGIVASNKDSYKAKIELVRLNYLENRDDPCAVIEDLNPYISEDIAKAKLVCALFSRRKFDYETLTKLSAEDVTTNKKNKILNYLLNQNYHLAYEEMKSSQIEDMPFIKALINFNFGYYSKVKENLITNINSKSEDGVIELLSYSLFMIKDRQTFDAMIQQYPEYLLNNNVKKILATWEYAEGNYKKAESHFSELIRLDPDDEYSLSYLVQSLEKLGNLVQATKYNKQLKLIKLR